MPTPRTTREGDTNDSDARRAWHVERSVHPGSRELLERDAGVFFHQALSSPCLDVVVGADGSTLTLADGRELLDFHGNSVHQVGFGHPRVAGAVAEQIRALPFCTRRFTNEVSLRLAERLVGVAPGKLRGNARVLFAPGGAQAVSMAVHIARSATGRTRVLSMDGSFHGATLGVSPIGGERVADAGLDHSEPAPVHVRPPMDPGCERCEGGACSGDCAEDIVERLRSEGDVAAVLTEPVRATTVASPPAGYWRRLREACDETGTLLIIDEIPTGLGRLGTLFASDRFGIEPDLVVMGKGLGGGIVPMAACLGRADLNEGVSPLRERSVGHFTHEKSPVGAAAAHAVLDVLEEEKLLDRAEGAGASWQASLERAFAGESGVAEIRRIGLMLGVVLAGPGARDRAERVMLASIDRGLSYKVGGAGVLVLAPPLTVTEQELRRATEILVEAYDATA